MIEAIQDRLEEQAAKAGKVPGSCENMAGMAGPWTSRACAGCITGLLGVFAMPTRTPGGALVCLEHCHDAYYSPRPQNYNGIVAIIFGFFIHCRTPSGTRFLRLAKCLTLCNLVG